MHYIVVGLEILAGIIVLGVVGIVGLFLYAISGDENPFN